MYSNALSHRYPSKIRMRLNVGALLLLAGLAVNCTTLAAQQASPTDSQPNGEIVMISPFNPTYSSPGTASKHHR